MLAIRLIPHFGIYFDEALFAPAVYQPDSSLVHISLFGVTLPVMVMGYVGALKVYLWKLIFAVAAPSVWSIRFPMLLAATLSAGIWGQTLTGLGAKRAASVCIGLMLTSASLLVSSTFDWGPAGLQLLLGALAINLLARERYPLLAGFLIGLALWDKLTFGFAYGPILALLIWRRPRWEIAAGFLAGAAPLIYGLTKVSPAQELAISISPELLWGRLSLMSTTLLGTGFAGFMTKGTSLPGFPPLFLLIVGLAFWLEGPWRRTRIGFGFCLLASWCGMALFNNIGMSVHHTVLLLPVLCALIALTVEDSGPMPWEAALLPLIAINLFCLYQLGRDVPTARWSPLLNDLASRLEVRQPRVVVCEDWGFQNTIWLMSDGKMRPKTVKLSGEWQQEDRNSVETALSSPGTVFVSFAEENRIMPQGHQSVEALAKQLGYAKASVERVRGIIEFDTYFLKPRN